MPSHTSNKNIASYKIYGTDEPYFGLTVEIGGELYSTVGGAREGDSLQLVPMNSNTTSNLQENTTFNPSISEDTVTPFKVTSNVSDEFFVQGFSDIRGGYFYDLQGIQRVPNGTRLHHHTNPASGDNNFMTKHTMDGAVNVFTISQIQQNRTQQNQSNNISTVSSAGRVSNNTMNNTRSSGGGGY